MSTVWQLSAPALPVQALALPLLTTTARMGLPDFTIFSESTTLGARTSLRVNTPAQAAGVSETMRVRSLVPFFLMPQAIPPALNPGT